jgi:hypothetical protein
MRNHFKTLAAMVAASLCLPLAASGAPSAGASRRPDTIGKAVQFDVSPPLRELAKRPPIQRPGKNVIPNRKVPDFVTGRTHPPGADPLLAPADAPVTAAATPSPSANFEGLSDDDNAAVIGGRVVPPDTEGDVGPNHYVQMINLITGVYDKNGNLLAPPFASNAIWNGLGGVCETENNGDPIVLYDHLADRWMFSQFALVVRGFNVRDSYECLAVSQGPDPLGPYYRYAFHVSGGAFDDYPKLGVWPDGYYMSVNRFGGNSFQGAVAAAFERDLILVGDPNARFVAFGPLECSNSLCFFSLQPSHLEGPAPAAGTPNTFVMAFDDETWGTGSQSDGYQLWDLTVDWTNPSNSTFTSLGRVTAPEFNSNLCGFAECVPQPSPGELLDTLSQFTMFRAQARSFPTHRAMVLNHTVNVGSNRAGIRWSELRNAGGGWSLHQTGTYAPNDGHHRWMGSAAMDQSGNIALGFSISSSTLFPSIRYVSRTAGDALGTMPGGEVELVAGSDVQTSSSNRWGDYSTMSVDPVDGCTFWYTQEYQRNDDTRTDFDFKTRIGAFVLPECSPAACGDGTCGAGEDSCSCPSDCGAAPTSETSCSDGIDNDCDGFVDCDDADCGSDPACAAPFCGDLVCDAGEDQCNCAIDCGSPPSTETQCSDGVDNDCDGLVDGDDPDCQLSCGDVGSSCTTDSDCCSNKCRGRPGAQTCKS